jgi:[protein-PII] uridylyltransferase
MLLNELYARTRSFLRRGPEAANRSALAERRRRRVAELLGEPPADVDAWLAAVPDRTVSTVSPRVLAALRRLERSREAAGKPVAIEVTVRRGASEVLVVAPDAPGLLSLIAGVFTANRVEVVGAQIHSRPGLALDVFTVRDRAGRPIPPGDPRWAAVEADLGRLLSGSETVASLVEHKREKAGLPRRVTPEVPTEVEIDNDASDGFTVIDVYTQDRPGVLYAITRTLSELGLDIGLSKVATEADRVADIFYVRDRDGRKIVEEGRLGEIASRLRQAL